MLVFIQTQVQIFIWNWSKNRKSSQKDINKKRVYKYAILLFAMLCSIVGMHRNFMKTNMHALGFINVISNLKVPINWNATIMIIK